MAIPLSSTNGLFTRLGLIGGRINAILGSQGVVTSTPPAKSAGTQYTGLQAQFTSTTAQSDLFDSYVTNILNPSRAASAEIATLKAWAAQILLRMVNDDKPQKSATSIPLAMAELARQMGPNISDAKFATKCSVAASAPTAETGNVGGAIVASSVVGPLMPHPVEFTTGTSQMDLQYLIPETVIFKCTSDSYSGFQSAYQETFSFNGQAARNTSPLTWDYSTLFGGASNGSGASGNISVCNPAIYQGAGVGGNILYNGDMVGFTTNVPNQWTGIGGTAGTDYLDGLSGFINTGHSLAFAGTGTGAELSHRFNNAGGTTVALLPNTVYAISFWAKCTSSTSNGVSLSLTTGAQANIINDNNAVANTLTVAASSMTTSYTNFYGFFRTPATIPSGAYLSIYTTGAMGSGKTMNISSIAMRPAVQLYLGGPYVALFSGLLPSVLNDTNYAAFTNNWGGGTNKMGLQALMNALFDLRTQGIPPLPVAYVSTLSLADSLVA